MARTLFESEPVFRETVERCADVLDGVLPRPLLEVMFDTGPDAEEALRNTTFAQPALFAVEMALARLWQSWGIQPDVVMGHSVGQYAAACVAGVFDLDDGARLIAERGRLFGTLPAGGRMVAVFADADKVEQCAAEYPRLSVAAYNGASTVLSGPGEDIERAAAALLGCGYPMRVAGDQSCLPLRAARPRSRRVRVVRRQCRILAAAAGARLQSHRRGTDTAKPPRRAVLATARTPAGPLRRQRRHARGPGLRGADGARPATDSHRGSDAGLARRRTDTADHRVAAPR